MADILDDFPRGVQETRIKSQNFTPQARWRSSQTIIDDPDLQYDPQNPGGKLLLGALNNRLIAVADDRAIITTAGSRSGKGVSMILPNLLFFDGSVLAIDPKGELASITARRRGEGFEEKGGKRIDGLGQKVFVLDPFDRTAEWVKPYKASFNPMSILTPDNQRIVEDAGLIADALVVPGGGNEIHWDETAKSFIEGLILHVATYPDYEGRRNLVTVRELLIRGVELPSDIFEEEEGEEVEEDDKKKEKKEKNKKIREGIIEQIGSEHMAGLWIEMDSNGALDGFIQGAATEMFERDSKEMNSVLSSARRHTTFLGFPVMKDILLDHPEFTDLGGMKTRPEGMTVYLCLPPTRMSTFRGWFRIFVNLALEAMERVKGRPACGVQTLFCLDEFTTSCGKLQTIEDSASFAAGDPYYIKLWVILQDLAQLESLYKDRWQTFVGNAGILQFFGNNDIKTLEYISQRLGKTSLLVTSQGSVSVEKRKTAETGLSQSMQVFDLMTAEEVGRFFARDAPQHRQLIIRAGKDPAMAIERVIYHDEKSRMFHFFKGKFDELETVRTEKTKPKGRLSGFIARMAGD